MCETIPGLFDMCVGVDYFSDIPASYIRQKLGKFSS